MLDLADVDPDTFDVFVDWLCGRMIDLSVSAELVLVLDVIKLADRLMINNLKNDLLDSGKYWFNDHSAIVNIRCLHTL